MSKETVKLTYDNAMEYFRKNHRIRGGMLFEKKGFFADIPTEKRTHSLLLFVDEKAELVYIEVYAGIQVNKPYFAQVSSYIEKINSERKCTSLRIHENGAMYCHSEQDIEYDSASKDTIHNMEIRCVSLLEIYGDVLDKLAHGVLLEPDEIDPDKVEHNYAEQKLREIKELRRELEEDDVPDFDFDDDFDVFDDDFEDDDEETDLAEPEGLSDEFRSKLREEFERHIKKIEEERMGGLDFSPNPELTTSDFDDDFITAFTEGVQNNDTEVFGSTDNNDDDE